MRGRRRGWVRWLALGCGLALLAGLVRQIGAVEIASLLAALGGNFVIIVAIFSCHEFVRAASLGFCIGRARRPPYRRLLRVRFIGEAVAAVTRTGPLAGEPARAFVLARQADRAAQAVGNSASELLANSLMSAVVTISVVLAGLWTGRFHGPVHVLALVLFWGSLGFFAIAVTALATRTYVVGGIVAGIGRLPRVGRALTAKAAHVRQAEDAIVQSLTGDPVALAWIVVLELVSQFILVFEIYWTVRSMGLPITFASALLVEVLIKAPNIVQFVGVTEGGYALVFTWVGLPAAAGFTLSLVRLLRSLTASAVWLTVLAQLERPRSQELARRTSDILRRA
jgi:hypothetical protein